MKVEKWVVLLFHSAAN